MISIRPGQCLWAAVVLLCFASAVVAGNPIYAPGIVPDTVPHYDTSSYDRTIPAPNSFTQYPIGQYPARWYEVLNYARAVAEKSDRVNIVTQGRTHEGRELVYLLISSPRNLQNVETLRGNMLRLADPSQSISPVDFDKLVQTQPAFAWMGYSIHGDELSGTDAAVRLIWHLAAANDSATIRLLDNVVVIVDPSENPDGRDRILSMLETYRSGVPNWDAQAMQHNGVWPWGRANHYWFDLNRDWIFVTQPETQARMQTILKYHPLMVVDAHEMGSDDNFLFGKPREPINPNTPPSVMKWMTTFTHEQAEALDTHGWPYYTGEWHEQWYIGYGSAWPTMFGALAILYEQANVGGGAILQSGNYLLHYQEAVHHQFASSLANLTSLTNHRVEMLRDYRETRRQIADNGRKSNLTYLIAPGRDRVRLNTFVKSLTDQGIQVQKATIDFTVGNAIDMFHKAVTSKRLPAGTIIVSTAQPHGALVKAILDFDPHFDQTELDLERTEVLKTGGTRQYETTAWSVALGYGLEAYTSTAGISVAMEPVTTLPVPTGRLENPAAQVGFMVNMQGELTYRLLNQLYQHGVVVFTSENAVTVEGRRFERGSLYIRKRGNAPDVAATLEKLAAQVGITIYGVNTGFATEGSMLGAPTFRLLNEPRLALVVGSPTDFTSAGSIWFTIDEQLELPHSLINVEGLPYTNLDKYNVLIVPDAWGGELGQHLGKGGTEKLRNWVQGGGTLILVGSSAAWAADTSTGLSEVRLRSQVIDKLADWDKSRAREKAAFSVTVDTTALWHPERAPKDTSKEQATDAKVSSEEEQYATRFQPRGAYLLAEVDTTDWLAFGQTDHLPVLLYTDKIFLSKDPVTTTARLTSEKNALRLSGLLWPEATERWAGSAFLTHESSGNGQLILFAGEPNTRAYSWGTRTFLANAILYGPGFCGSRIDYKK
jgi:hypothetical protein